MSHLNFNISPSLLSANFACLGEECKQVIAAGANSLHFDVMDQHFVKPLTIGPLVCNSLIKHGIKLPIDVHLMTTPVDYLIQEFAKAGASSIAFHPAGSCNSKASINLIHKCNMQAGIAINPEIPINIIENYLDCLDFILIMSVNPGFAGQKFIPASLDKIRRANKIILSANKTIRIAVDGGINLNNIAAVAKAGADTFIAGSTIFNSNDYAATITKMRSILDNIKKQPKF